MISETQRKERLKGLGGSDIPVILGLSTYKTPYYLFLEKTGQITETEEEGLAPLREWGNRIEPIVRIKFAESHNVRVTISKEEEDTCGTHKLIESSLPSIVHPSYDFLRGNLDGFIPEWNAVLEIKTSMAFMSKEWGEENTDSIPMAYLTQVAHYVACTNADKAIIAVLIGGNDYREFTYNRDLELEGFLINAACDFWEAVKSNDAPDPINMKDIKLLYPSSMNETTIIGSEHILSSLSSLREVKEKQKELTELENNYKLKIMEYMGESECLTDERGTRLATWKSSGKNGRRFLLKKTGSSK